MVASSPRNDEERTDTAPPLDRSAAEKLARTLRTVAEPTRLQLLSILAGSPAGEATVGELAEALGLRQPTVTHHVQIMVADELLVRQQRGRQVWVSIAEDRQAAVTDLLR